MEEIDLDALQKKVKKRLTAKRYHHTQGVRYTAAALAMRYGVDIRAASVGGILHDCAKCLSEEKMISECRKHHIAISEAEEASPYLLHAKLGAWYSKEKYGIEDREILQAIRYHTTGRPGMSVLEKIIFTADYIEPGRKMIPNLPAVRQMTFCNLDEAVCMILRDTLKYLKHSGKEIDPFSIACWEYYEKICRPATRNTEA